ncbi:MAG TPA: GFA family protein [Novosphingobium sp.]|nr:GFA family protein [Novosphingobium sp.]
MAYGGRCACGRVELAISGEPLQARQCWCRQCQKIAAGGPTNNAIFHTDDVTITGELASHGYVAASGNTLSHWFCPSCGSSIYAQSSARPHLKTVRLGVLDTPHGIRPKMAIWTDDAPRWAVIDPALAQFPAQPPAPAVSG